MTPFEFINKYITNKFKTINLKSGSYNQATLISNPVTIDNYEAFWVVKKPLRSNRLGFSSLNEPSRAFRKWREINPDLPVYLFDDQYWAVPFLGKERPTDEQISLAIIEIYQRTGNIIADGCNKENFVLFENEVVCVDMDLAIRRNSIASDEYFDQVIKHKTFDKFYDVFFDSSHTNLVVKTLFYIENFLSAQELDHTLVTPWIVKQLHAFRLFDSPLTEVQFSLLQRLDGLRDIYYNLDDLINFDVLIKLSANDLSLTSSELYEKVSNLRAELDNPYTVIADFNLASNFKLSGALENGSPQNSIISSMLSDYTDSGDESDLLYKSEPSSLSGSLESSPYFYENRFFSSLHQRSSETKERNQIQRRL